MTGDILIDSRACAADFQRKTGYVQQEDIHLPTSTVREALEFSMQLRQPDSRNLSKQSDYVQTVIEILDMSSYAEAIIGITGEGRVLTSLITAKLIGKVSMSNNESD